MTAGAEPMLVIRADAGPGIGLGHVMRCLALAQAWRDRGGAVTLVTAAGPRTATERFREEDCEVVEMVHAHPIPDDWARTSEFLAGRPRGWVVVDGYHFDTVYHERIRATGHHLLAIDDRGCGPPAADIVVNPTVYAEAEPNNGEPRRLLTGSQYALLRREFTSLRRPATRTADQARRVLVTLGGGRTTEDTAVVLAALDRLTVTDLEVRVVAGASSSDCAAVETAVGSRRFAKFSRFGSDIPELMAWADVAVSGGGGTCAELAFMGVPNVIIVRADNQRAVADGFARAGASLSVGDARSITPGSLAAELGELVNDPVRRAEMSRRGRGLVDGCGRERVTARLAGDRIVLRYATEDDGPRLWAWANDPEARAVSFSPGAIVWAEHVRWLESRLHDPDSHLFIALNEDDVAVGQVRFDIRNHAAVISVNLGAEWRRRGYGPETIRAGCRALFRASNVDEICAHVKAGNDRSVRAFVESGFERVRSDTAAGVPTHVFRLHGPGNLT